MSAAIYQRTLYFLHRQKYYLASTAEDTVLNSIAFYLNKGETQNALAIIEAIEESADSLNNVHNSLTDLFMTTPHVDALLSETFRRDFYGGSNENEVSESCAGEIGIGRFGLLRGVDNVNASDENGLDGKGLDGNAVGTAKTMDTDEGFMSDSSDSKTTELVKNWEKLFIDQEREKEVCPFFDCGFFTDSDTDGSQG